MRGRLWCFVINNYTDDDIIACMSLGEEEARYMILGYEVGKKGTPHIQGFVYFDNARSRRTVSKLIPRASLELCRGSFADNVEYCSKDENVYEAGDRPHPGMVDRARIEDIMANPWENFHLYNQYRRAYKEIKASEYVERDRVLILCPMKDRFYEANTRFEGKTISMKGSEYDGEDVIFMSVYTDLHLENWLNGFSSKYKVGYEYRFWNPEIVVLLYENDMDYNYAMKEYGDLFDEVIKE